MECFLCHQKNIFEFLNLGKQPLANKYPSSEKEFKTEDFFPLSVFFCPHCKNVQLGTVVSRERMFEDYYYLSSVNPGLVEHFRQWAKKMTGSNFVVDIGSNDGIFLKPLKDLGINALGVDPSINVSKIANDAGLTTITSFFNKDAVQKIKKQYGQPDVVVASSIFTHLENPHQFIEDVKDLMQERGRFIIEVEYIADIIKNVDFERFYLDRVFYYSLTSLKFLFENHGMKIVDAEKIKPHGGSIRVTACNFGAKIKQSGRLKQLLLKENKNLTKTSFQEFKKKVAENIFAFGQKLAEYKRLNLKVAGYGAPARVATICNYGGIGRDLVDFIVDDSPLKQGRFTPGTHIPIVENNFLEKNKPDVMVVFAYEYLDDIKKKTKGGNYKYLVPMRG